MSRTLLTHASSNLLRRLARERLQATPTITLVPNLAAGRSLRQMTRQAVPTVTFAQLARRELADAGWSPLPALERGARLLDLLGRLDLEYFGPIVQRPGTVAALGDVIRALLRSDASRLPPGRTPRERDLSALHRTWVLELLRDGLFDAAVPEFFAARAALSPRLLTVSGFAYLDAAQIAYLDRLAAPGSAMYLAAATASGLAEAHRTAQALVGRGWTAEGVVRPREDRDPRARIGDRAARITLDPESGQTPECAVFVLPGAVEEAREVLRQVKRAHQQGGRPWHELAIVVRDEATYLGPLVDAARRYGVPLVSQARRPLLHSPLGSLLAAWTEAGRTGWPFEATAAVLTHPLVAGAVTVGARLGRRTPDGLAAWQLGPQAAHLEWPAAASGEDYLRFITRSLDAWGVLARQRRDPALGAALAATHGALAPLSGGEVQERAAFLGALRLALSQASVPVWPGKGGVRVTTPLGTLGRSFQAVWVLGLSEGGFPRPASDPPLLDAHLRAHWSQSGVALPGGVESQAIEQALFFHALACAREELTLTRPEVSAGRRAPPSPYLRPFTPGGPPATLHAGTAREARVHQAALGTLNDDRVAGLATLELARERGQAEGPLLPGAVNPDTWRWSASQLHRFGACHYQWFAGKVMRLQPLPEPRRGLDPLGQGSLYHLALERLLTPYKGVAAPLPDDLLGALPAAFDGAAETLSAAGEIDLGPLWAVERQDHLAVLSRSVVAPDFLPAGQRVHALEQPLDGHVMVDGVPWAFSGYANRIDEGPDGRTVTDYKLGAYISRVQDGAGRLNTEVQLTLYLLLGDAVQGRYYSLKRAAVLQGTGPAWSGKAEDTGGWSTQLRTVQHFLSGARADVQRGDFRARPDAALKACAYCDVAPVCRFQAFSAGDGA